MPKSSDPVWITQFDTTVVLTVKLEVALVAPLGGAFIQATEPAASAAMQAIRNRRRRVMLFIRRADERLWCGPVSARMCSSPAGIPRRRCCETLRPLQLVRS